MTAKDRSIAKKIAYQHLNGPDLLGWFEVLYSQAGQDPSIIPWADLSPNPNIVEWFDSSQPALRGKALKIGCGLGDDAEELARRGFETTAFDISASAVAWCRRRYPRSSVRYVAADLFSAPCEWAGEFDFVLEAYTLQVLPPDIRAEAVRRIAAFVAGGGTLLVVARGREPGQSGGTMPWPLTVAEVSLFKAEGLAEVSFEDYLDREDPPVRRLRATYRRL